MSVIIVKVEKDEIIVGADTQDTYYGKTKESVLDSKLKTIGDVVVGTVGDGHCATLLFSYLGKHKLNVDNMFDMMEYFKGFQQYVTDVFGYKEPEESGFVNSHFLLVVNKKVWIFNNFYLREVLEGEYSSIGSGMAAALSCMYICNDVETSLEAVSKYDLFCSGPNQIIKVKK